MGFEEGICSITHISGLIPTLVTTHEPPSRGSRGSGCASGNGHVFWDTVFGGIYVRVKGSCDSVRYVG